jgi:LPXTG-motif cell wall-anchored protein
VAPAHAAPGATIEVDTDFAFIDEPLGVFGDCPTTAEEAVVTLTQAGEQVGGDASDVQADGTYDVMLDLTGAAAGPATVTVDCVVYGQPDPLASASTDIFVSDVDFDFDFEVIEVALSARTVALGGTLRVSATCPKGSAKAVVMAGNEEADEPFFTRELTLAADGRVSVDVPIAASGSSTPATGTAAALVLCGGSGLDLSLLEESGLEGLADTDQLPTAMGFAEFTITPAVARSAVPVDTTTARRELANTGSENGPLTAIALALIAAGAGALRLSRRA